MTSDTALLEKVTDFITRETPCGREILVFRHPTGSIQLPAGTMEVGETAVAAALREAQEETGLTSLSVVACLGSQLQSPFYPGMRAVLRPVHLLQSPLPSAAEAIPTFLFPGLRRGLYVRQTGDPQSGYTPVAYEEFDGPAHEAVRASRSVCGWVESAALAAKVVRHFFHLIPTGPTDAVWTQEAEEWRLSFALFWLPLHSHETLAALVPSQSQWLSDFAEWLS